MISRDVVLLATADWDNPFWTNKQHVAAGLADRGFRVLYIESLGLRRPSASAHDAGRIMRRLRRALAGPRLVRPHLWVWSPVVLPLQRHASARALNRAVLRRRLDAHIASLGLQQPVLWTYNPMSTRLLRIGRFERIVYHCVDDIAAQPGMPAELLEQAERELVHAADIVFASSPALVETRRRWNSKTHYLPNVADYDHFSRALGPELSVPADLARIPAPRLGFIGAISGYKVDFELIRHIAERRPDWSIVLIGKVGEGEPWTDAARLHGLPNLHLLGPRAYGDLPAYLKGIDVALLPNMRNEYTASMFPMKFFEYLAAGRPIVSVDLPALREYAGVVRIASSPDEFIAAIVATLRGEVAPLENRVALARGHTYAARMERMLALLDGDEVAGTHALAASASGDADAGAPEPGSEPAPGSDESSRRLDRPRGRAA
jgi:glycosyltransferase involved in cell wall biosynthesis